MRGEHATAIVADYACQCVGKLLTAAHEAGGAVDIQHVDECVDICRRVTGHTPVEWVEICQQFAQPWVGYVARYKLVGRNGEHLGVRRQAAVGGLQVEERHLVGDAVEAVYVCLYSFRLLGKVRCQRCGEALAARCYAEDLAGSLEAYFVHTPAVDVVYVEAVEDAEIAAYFIEAAARLEAAHDVHARLEGLAAAREALQAAPDDAVFLQHGHLAPVAGEEGACEEASYTAAYYYDAFFHLLASIIC